MGSHTPSVATISHTSKICQHDIGKYLGMPTWRSMGMNKWSYSWTNYGIMVIVAAKVLLILLLTDLGAPSTGPFLAWDWALPQESSLHKLNWLGPATLNLAALVKVLQG